MLLLAAASGCGFELNDQLGKVAACSAAGTARGIGDAVGAALGAPSTSALKDDAGEVVPAAEGICATELYVTLLREGSTTLRTRLADVTTLVQLEAR